MKVELLAVVTMLLSGACAAIAVVDLVQYRTLRQEYVNAGILQGAKS